MHGVHMKTIVIDQAVAMIPNGASLMIGGFMGVGTPERMVDEIVRQGKRAPPVHPHGRGDGRRRAQAAHRGERKALSPRNGAACRLRSRPCVSGRLSRQSFL